MNYKDIETYNYELDESLIAQTPIKERDHSRLLIVNKNNGNHKDEVFYNIINYLHKGDVLVLNNTKVLPSRIIGYKEETNAKIEVLLLTDLGNDIWECLVRPQKRVKEGTKINFEDDFSCTAIKLFEDGITHFKFEYKGIFVEHLNNIGAMPLPPYIHEELKDNDRYNTVYAKINGSAAAPTAGLHFTKELFDELKSKGIEVVDVTLHIGLGTFKPVKENDIRKHDMHFEYYSITSDAAKTIEQARKEKRRIISIGTTSTRTLESVYNKFQRVIQDEDKTNLFIYPGYKFNVVDALITNFHLPKSTLLMLVSAFANRELILKAYNYAVENKFRFFSFGDAMLIL